MHKNDRIILGVIIAFFVLFITTIIFFTWADSKIADKSITGGLLIANLSVAIFIYLQIRQSNNHFLDLNRPWIHLDLGYSNITSYRFRGEPSSDTLYPLFLVNKGNLAALDVKIVLLESESEIGKQYLDYIPKNIHLKTAPPNFKHRVLNDVDYFISPSQCLAFSISYKFNDKTYKNNAYVTNFDGQVPTCTDKKPDIKTENK